MQWLGRLCGSRELCGCSSRLAPQVSSKWGSCVASRLAIMPPMCKSTPWNPRGSEAATDAQAPRLFKSRVFMDRNSGTSTPFSRLASSWTAPNVLRTVYVRIQLQCGNMWIGMKTNAQQYLLCFPSQHTLATGAVSGDVIQYQACILNRKTVKYCITPGCSS